MNADPKLAVFWGDTRTLLTRQERKTILASAKLEDITPEEVLLRDTKSGRTIVVTSTDEKNLFCSLCASDRVHREFGKKCPKFARCAIHGRHMGKIDPDES
jgi:hypothetical protein